MRTGDLIDTADIPEFFERYGWDYERRGDALFRTGFRGDEGEYEIWVRLSDVWVFFTIDPLIDLPPSGAHGPEVVDLILRINEEINYAKFALDGDGDLALSVEIPREGTGYSHFADALGALAHYADQYRRDFDRAAEPEVRDDT